MTGILLKFSNNFPVRILPQRTSFKNFQKSSIEVSFQTLSEQTKIDYSNQPRLNPKLKNYFNNSAKIPLYTGTFYSFNPFVLNHIGSELPTVTIKGMVTELGAPILGKRVLVILMTTDGNVVEKVHTDLEGNFIFYEIPQNLSLMAVAVDATYKYNAVILAKILTVNNGV